MGGVGTETQIITPDIYGKQEQFKFVAVVMERKDDGTPCLPIYYKSRIFIDLSDAASYAGEFEKIVRWVFDEPLHKKPEIGQKPTFLVEDGRAVKLGTSARFKRAMDAVRSGREFANAAVEEYFGVLAEELEQLRIREKAEPFDDQVVESIDNFLPYRDEAISVFSTIALYRDQPENRRNVHRFFERLIPYLNRPAGVSSWEEWDFDNFKFMIHELYIYAVATFIKRAVRIGSLVDGRVL